MKMNSFLSNESLNGIDANVYSIIGLEDTVSINDRFSGAWRLSRRLRPGLAVPFHNGNEIFVIGQGRQVQKEVVQGNLVAKLKERVSINSELPDIRAALTLLFNECMKERMRDRAYRVEKSCALPQNPETHRLDNGEPIQVFRDGFTYQVEVLVNGHVLVWLDPKTRIKQNVRDRIAWMHETSTREAIEKELVGISIISEPYGTRGRISSIEWGSTPRTRTVVASPDIQQKTWREEVTLQDYWKLKHHIPLNPDESPLIMVTLKGRDQAVTYPPGKVFIPTKGKPLSADIRKTFMMAPGERSKKTESLAKMILDEPFAMGGHIISFVPTMMDVDRLRKTGKIVGTGIVQRPDLYVGNTRPVKHPKEIRKHGPFSGPRIIPVHYLIPEGSPLDLDSLHEGLQRSMQQLHLGKIVNIGRTYVHYSGPKPGRNDYWEAARSACQEVERGMKLMTPDDGKKGKPVIVSVLPGMDSESYSGGKQAAHAARQVIQGLTIQTAQQIVNSNQFPAVNIALQLYLKCLERGEAPWILKKPAGGMAGTAYLGYDVSRRFEEEGDVKREAVATIAMVDSLGRHILNRIHTTKTGEKLDERTANRLIFDVCGEAHVTFKEYGETFKRMVIFKDGIIHDAETASIRRGAMAAIGDMDLKTTMPSSVSLDLVSVVKSSIERVYTDDGMNVEDGRYLVFADGNAVVVNSHLDARNTRVTAQPIRIEPKFRIDPDRHEAPPLSFIDEIVREFCDLSNLDWASLYHQTKYPIVLRLVQSLGEQYTLDIPDPSYLPL